MANKNKKWTMARLKREVWSLLCRSDLEIYLIDISKEKNKNIRKDTVGFMEVFYDDDDNEIGIVIKIDYCACDVASTVVHELFHYIFNDYFKPIASYTIYENWISSLEKPFFKSIPMSERSKWYRKIRSKIVEIT